MNYLNYYWSSRNFYFIRDTGPETQVLCTPTSLIDPPRLPEISRRASKHGIYMHEAFTPSPCPFGKIAGGAVWFGFNQLFNDEFASRVGQLYSTMLRYLARGYISCRHTGTSATTSRRVQSSSGPWIPVTCDLTNRRRACCGYPSKHRGPSS
jgi:hypothetical protein